MSTPPQSEKLIRITSFIKRKKGTTPEAFYKYWVETHAPVCRDFMLRHGVVEYVQYHTTPETKGLGQEMADAAGREMFAVDGISDAYVHDFKTFQDAFKDPEYMEKIRPDELAFIDVESLQMTIGYNYAVIEGGKLVETHYRKV